MLNSLILRHKLGDKTLGSINDGLVHIGLLLHQPNLIGVELVELNPLVDPTYVTPLVANRCAREILTGVAMRKKGITEPHYLAPEVTDHGQL